MTSQTDQQLLEREARFWDEQEEAIDDLYGRPHDWRFIPSLANMIIKPKLDCLRSLISKHRKQIDSVLDIGCGNGWFCQACAQDGGIRAYGVDVSEKKIITARRTAEERNLSELCRFDACNIMDLKLPEKVDLLTAHGSLHHFPGLEVQLPTIVDRFLKPGGLMLFVEPHCGSGISPATQNFIMKTATSKLWGRFFDKEFYYEVIKSKEGGRFDIRGESPAGLEFFGAEPDMDKIFADYQLITEKYFQCMSGHITNAFYVYMKSRLIRVCYRMLLPFIVWLDDRRCNDPEHYQYAEEKLWFLRYHRDF